MRTMLFIVAVLWLLDPPALQAASFDCGKAEHPVEKAVCRNGDLSRQDEEMASLYTQLLKQSAGDAKSRTAVQDWQRKWVRSLRDQKSGITDKQLALAYESRIQALRQRICMLEVQGTWVREDFAALVDKTRAPQAAAERANGNPLWVRIFIEQDGRYLMAVSTGHEGWTRQIGSITAVPTQSAYRLLMSRPEMVYEPQKPATTMLTLHKPPAAGPMRMHIDLLTGGGVSEYRHVAASFSEYLNRSVLSGVYRDERGQEYRFDEQGLARWPDRTFEYRIVEDSMESGCEYFNYLVRGAAIQEGRYGYAWKDGKLEIYDIVDGASVNGPPISCSRKPIAVLKPLDK